MNNQLRDRLVPLSNKLKEAVERGANEANSRNLFYSGQAVVLKTKYWLEVLYELLEIHAKYSSNHDLDQINQFIDAEKTSLVATFDRHGFSGSYDKLDSGVTDLKILLKDQGMNGVTGMDDLRSKTDNELRDIMRASINNSYVPSSIYHKAKQELEFRAADSKSANSSTVTQNFHGPVGTVSTNNGTSVARQSASHENKRKPWENPLFLAILGILGSIIAGYVIYKFGWN